MRGSYNVVQNNFMAHARVGGDGRYGPLASIRGKQNIVRWNVFFDAIKRRHPDLVWHRTW